ncbi:MAG: cyclic nucleotide-binding domain-containing protein [Rhodospirillales bacterium]|nr:cyclic nucleotide-binding domain-containing protein [Rhodospirillales bacterium]
MSLTASNVEKKFYNKGEMVFEEGQAGDCAYIVEMGQVEIFKRLEGETVHLAAMGEGELFGEMAVIDGSPRMANARAVEDSVIIFLPKKLFNSKLQKFDPVIRSMIQILLDNLRNVHKSYMHRPRSIEDYLNAMAFHSEGFQKYLLKLPDDTAKVEGQVQLQAIDKSITNLRAGFRDHKDVRSSALSETDISSRLTAKDGKGTGA